MKATLSALITTCNFYELERIIVRDKYITDPAELSKPLSSREDAWNFIIEDLKRATSLPATRDADNVGRATAVLLMHILVSPI